MDYLPLLGVAVVVVGLVLRLNPLIVVLTAGILTGLIAHMSPLAILAAIGRAVTANRLMLLFILVLPVVGVLERHGLRERAEMLIRGLQRLTSGGILFGYMLARQVSAAFGLQLGGHPQFIRPLIAPMAEAAAERDGMTDEGLAERVKATAAAAENVGNFFGQMIFIAASGLLLIKGTLDQAGHPVSVEAMALWAIPTAIAAFLISVVRFLMLDRDIRRAARGAKAEARAAWARSSPSPTSTTCWGHSCSASRFSPCSMRATRSAGARPPSGGCSASSSPSAVFCRARSWARSSWRWQCSPRSMRWAVAATTKRRARRASRAQALGLWLFGPALVIPVVTFGYAFLFPTMPTPALVGLGLAALAAFLVALAMTGERPVQAIQEGRRLIDSISWAAILPPFLAALGALFAEARVGDLIAQIARAVVAPDSRLAVVATYCVAMAVFTAIMGNAFAAFAVITAGIGIPLLIVGQGGDPVVIGVIGMLSGFCGTLTTPMAANFNIVPAALLELKDKNAVIRAQIPIAIPLLLANIVLMYFLGFAR